MKFTMSRFELASQNKMKIQAIIIFNWEYRKQQRL